MKILPAIYDLSMAPVTFDFVHFLIWTELCRQELGYDSTHVVFVPGENYAFRKGSERDLTMSDNRKDYRLHNLLAPCTHLIPNCTFSILSYRGMAKAFLNEHTVPRDYTLEKPHTPYLTKMMQVCNEAGNDLHVLKTPQFAVNTVSHLVGNKRVATITLRDSIFFPLRNSNLKEWVKVADWLESNGIHPVFIPDTEAVLEGKIPDVGKHELSIAAAMNVEIRSAYYELSEFNLMVSGGPYTLALYNKNSHLAMFKIQVDAYKCTSGTFLKEQGFETGKTPAYANDNQKFIWAEDTFENITSEAARSFECLAA